MVLGVAATFAAIDSRSALTMAAVAAALWTFWSCGYAVYERLANRRNRLAGLRRLPRHFVGMVLAHFGIGVFILGVTLVSTNGLERDIALKPGESTEFVGYTVRFDGVGPAQGPNYRADRGTVYVFRDGEEVAVLHPEKRYYPIQQQPMTEAAIDAGFFRDVYVALGEPLGNGAWAVRVYYKPLVRWIWLGPLLMGIGGLLAASDRRYRLKVREVEDAGTAPSASVGLGAETSRG